MGGIRPAGSRRKGRAGKVNDQSTSRGVEEILR